MIFDPKICPFCQKKLSNVFGSINECKSSDHYFRVELEQIFSIFFSDFTFISPGTHEGYIQKHNFHIFRYNNREIISIQNETIIQLRTENNVKDYLDNLRIMY